MWRVQSSSGDNSPPVGQRAAPNRRSGEFMGRLADSPFNESPASEKYSRHRVPQDLLDEAAHSLSSTEGVNSRHALPVEGQIRVGLSVAGAGRCRSQSFPRKRESISQTFGNTRSTDWIPPAMAGREWLVVRTASNAKRHRSPEMEHLEICTTNHT